jgi:phosphoglycolate phosphatase
MRGILFDKDGTLIDFHASWSRLFRELCLDLAEGDGRRAHAMLRQGGMDPETGIVRAGSVFAAGNSVDIVDAWYPELPGAARTGMVERIDQVFYENGIRYSVPIPGVKETLARLAEAGMTMGVATSDGTAGTRAALAVLGMQTYLPHVFGYDSVAAPKPAPDIVFAFAEAMGAHPEVRDRESGRPRATRRRHPRQRARSARLAGDTGRRELIPAAEKHGNAIASGRVAPALFNERGEYGAAGQGCTRHRGRLGPGQGHGVAAGA